MRCFYRKKIGLASKKPCTYSPFPECEKKLSASQLKKKAQKLLDVIAENPFQSPPPYEKLTSDLSGAYSRRINI